MRAVRTDNVAELVSGLSLVLHEVGVDRVGGGHLLEVVRRQVDVAEPLQQKRVASEVTHSQLFSLPTASQHSHWLGMTATKYNHNAS